MIDLGIASVSAANGCGSGDRRGQLIPVALIQFHCGCGLIVGRGPYSGERFGSWLCGLEHIPWR